ncbi:hypothetical protein FXW78_34020 [Rhodococcus opacus]|nr:hypothetical protein [Rhodococcus opacus]
MGVAQPRKSRSRCTISSTAPLISRDFFTIRHCDQCHPALAADASTCSWRRNTDPSKVPSRERHDRVVTITELSPSRRDTDFTPLTVSIVALDEQTVGTRWVEGTAGAVEALDRP